MYGKAVILVLWLALRAGAAEPGPLVIRGAQVFDPEGGVFVARTLVIEGGHIRGVLAPGGRIDAPAGARVLDAAGTYALPGLIDAHAHLVHLLASAQVTGDEILPLYLANGITTVRDTGDEIVAQKLVARFAEEHPGQAPRVFLASPLIDGDPPYHRGTGRAVTDAAAVPAFVREMLGWGVATFKIYVGTGPEVGRAVIEEAHRHGARVTAHLGKYTAQQAVADGIDALEHIASVFEYALPADVPVLPPREVRQRLPEGERRALERRVLEARVRASLDNPRARDLVRALVERRVAVDPTLVVYRNWMLLRDVPEIQNHPDHARLPERLRRTWSDLARPVQPDPATLELRRAEFRKLQELTGTLYRAGVTLLAGTDAPVQYCPPGFAIHQELELLVASGLPPAAALRAATLQNARALGAADRLGTLEEGKLADLVLLDADPLRDIRNTRRIFKVVHGGIARDPAELLALVPAR
jgi:imidazolonepropionase-like amidohydrolase